MDMSTIMNMVVNTTGPVHMMHSTPSMTHDSAMKIMSHSMEMHTGFTETIVFSGWKTSDVGSFIGSCIGLFFIALAYELIKFVRSTLLKLKYLKRMRIYKTAKHDSSSNDSIEGEETLRDQTKRANYFKRVFNVEHLLQTISYFFQVFIAYFLMLAFMTYNYWICLSILLGLAVGYFFFGYQRSVYEIDEDCCI